jgi:integrase
LRHVIRPHRVTRPPRRARADRTTAHLITDYTASGCPDRNLQPRAGTALAGETANLHWITQYFGAKKPTDLKPTDSTAYLAWRKTKIAPHYSGKRTAELELQSLANCFTWAQRDGRLDRRPELLLRLRTARDIRHARALMPATAGELHAIATRFFTPQPGCHAPGCTEVYGWLALFLPFTGLRIGEAVQLLRHPTRVGLEPPAGYTDTTHLHIAREKRGINPRVRLDDPERPHIKPLLDMIRAWGNLRYPASPWLFPAANAGQLSPKPLTKALARACKNLHLPHRTAHGYRAYYCTARLAQGTDIEDVARELGQRSGEDLVRDIYSLELDAFHADTFRSLRDTITWLPGEQSPAWTWWTTQPSNIIQLAAS